MQLSRLDYNRKNGTRRKQSYHLLKAVVTKVEMTAKNKKQHLNCIFDEGQKIMAVIDRDGIEQVLMNVLSNAIKYTQEGGRIDIDAIQADKNARLIITDNGIGIPEKELSRVFERFFRVDKARSRAMGGTGLGWRFPSRLSRSGINGTIEIESKEGKGTRVIISRCPLSPSAAEK